MINATLRSKENIILSMASSRIVALLLKFGKTARAMFKIHVNLIETTYCSFSKHSELASLVGQTSLIIWDEAHMTHCFMIEIVDRTLRGICDKKNMPFEGKLIAFDSDLRQILPVVTKASRVDIVATSLSRSDFSIDCHVMYLKINMRLRDLNLNTHEYECWCQFEHCLLNIGNGSLLEISL